MLLIECPFCGPRDEQEFRCGGQGHITRPGLDAGVTDADWGAYLFVRDNPRGDHAERWLHRYGCGRWFNMIRHTGTHAIGAVYRMGQPRPVAAIPEDTL